MTLSKALLISSSVTLKDSRIALDLATNNYYAAVCEYLIAYFDWEKAVGRTNVEDLAVN